MEAWVFLSGRRHSSSSPLSGRATFPPCRGEVSRFAEAPPSSCHRRGGNNQRRFPSRHRAKVFQWDCRRLRKLSRRRLSKICNRPLAQTISRGLTQDVLERPTSRRAWPQFPCATHPEAQSVSRNRACVRQRRAARRHISRSLFRSSRFFPPERRSWNLRTTPHPSTRDKHS